MLARTFLVAFALGCSAPPPPAAPSTEPEWMDLDAGLGCVTAKVACGVGNCAARIHNQCDAPLTCELSVQCICRAFTGETGEATSRARDTVPAGARVGLRAQVICASGEVTATHAKRLACR